MGEQRRCRPAKTSGKVGLESLFEGWEWDTVAVPGLDWYIRLFHNQGEATQKGPVTCMFMGFLDCMGFVYLFARMVCCQQEV